MKPALAVLRTEMPEFWFLGIEYAIREPVAENDFGPIWAHFFKSGGWDVLEPLLKAPYRSMVLYHRNKPGPLAYCIGSIVEETGKVPDGFTLARYPAGEFLVVTTEWLPTAGDALGENGLGQCNQYESQVPMPEGYERHDGPDSRCVLVEREHFDTPLGSRYEIWVPVRPRPAAARDGITGPDRPRP